MIIFEHFNSSIQLQWKFAYKTKIAIYFKMFLKCLRKRFSCRYVIKHKQTWINALRKYNVIVTNFNLMHKYCSFVWLGFGPLNCNCSYSECLNTDNNMLGIYTTSHIKRSTLTYFMIANSSFYMISIQDFWW